MSLSRRKALTLIGGGTVVAAAAGTAGFLGTRTPNKALAPWDLAGAYEDPRLNALSYALLAPNPHNMQPWLVELTGQDGVRLHYDKTRNLPETDPFDRQITIGFGCFLEQMVIAASAAGYSVDLNLYPEGEDGPVADATFSTGASADPLAIHIPNRRSCKEPYEARQLDPAQAGALAEFADIYTSEEVVGKLRDLTLQSWQIEASTHRTLKESIDLTRVGKAEVNANPDGIELIGAFFDVLKLTGMITREKMMDPNDINFRQFMDEYNVMLSSTNAYAALVSDSNTRQDQIDAGRRWLRLNLKTTALGLALHPVSQCLQEFPEMEGPNAEAHALLAEDGQTVQMLGRVGYGPESPRTPRWPLEAKRLDV